MPEIRLRIPLTMVGSRLTVSSTAVAPRPAPRDVVVIGTQ